MANIAVLPASITVNEYSASSVSSSVNNFVSINGAYIVVDADKASTHSYQTTTHTAPGFSSVIQSFVKINGNNVIVNGDSLSCGHMIVGTGFVTIS